MQIPRRHRRTAATPVQVVTSAGQSRPQEIRSRERSYLIKMGVRTVCLVLAIVITYPPLRVIFLIAAIALPWVSVVGANAGPVRRRSDAPVPYVPPSRPALESGRPRD